MNDRPIDKVRQSAGSMTFGAGGEAGEIDGMCEINGSLHIIMTKAIYLSKFADEIDPQRTNIAVPNMSQKVLSVGTESEIVRRVLMQAKRLFDTHVFGSTFDYKRAIDLSFESLKDLVGMDAMRLELTARLEKISEDLKNLKLDQKQRHIAVPSAGDVQGLAENFLQKADHAVMDLFAIAKLFYGGEIERGWFGALQRVVSERDGEGGDFTKFLKAFLPFLLFVRNARNAVEHPDDKKSVKVTDILLLPDGQLQPPHIEIFHSETHQPSVPLIALMSHFIDHISIAFELMMTHLSAAHVQPQAGLPLQIIEYTEDQQKAYKCRFGYGAWLGNQLAPFG